MRIGLSKDSPFFNPDRLIMIIDSDPRNLLLLILPDHSNYLVRPKLIRVLIIHSNLLLLAGVEDLLTHENDLQLSSVDFKNEKCLENTIARLKPNVVIFDDNVRFEDESILWGLIKKSPALRILIVGANKNLVQLFDKQEIQISHFKDLVTAIRGE